MIEYSIASFLDALAEDELEKKITKLLFTNMDNEKMLNELLKIVEGDK